MPTWADTSLESDTSIGSHDFIETFTYNGSEENDEAAAAAKKKGGWDWNLAYTYSKQSTPATATAAEITDISSQFIGNAAYKKDWEFGFGLVYAVTPAEDLRDVGPNISGGYTFKFGPKSSESFQPSLHVKATLGYLDYKEDYTSTGLKIIRNPRAIKPNGSQVINQSDFAFEADYSPLDWFTPKVSYLKYHYSRDVAQFLAALDRPQAVRIGASDISSTLAGFPKWTFEPGVTFYFLESWDFEFDFTVSEAQVDATKTYGYKGILSNEFTDHWSAAGGFEHDSSVDYGVDNLVLAQATYSY